MSSSTLRLLKQIAVQKPVEMQHWLLHAWGIPVLNQRSARGGKRHKALYRLHNNMHNSHFCIKPWRSAGRQYHVTPLRPNDLIVTG